MKQKLTILMFGLLLAVGWTSTAQAQRQNNSSPAAKLISAPVQEQATQVPQGLLKGQGLMRKAPRRANDDVYANTVYTKAQYGAISYTWYEGPTTNYPSHTASLTDTVTDPNQMYWLFRSTYMNQNIPGIRWNDVVPGATVYYGQGHGWNIGSPTKVDVQIYVNDQYGAIFNIDVYRLDGTQLYSWDAANSLPTGWSYTATPSRNTYGGDYYWYFTNGGSIFIPASRLPDEGCIVSIVAMSRSNSTDANIYVLNEKADESGWLTIKSYEFSDKETYTTEMWHDYGTITAPSLNGYTLFLLKLKDFPEYDPQTDYAAYLAEYNKRAYQHSAQELINIFDEYYASAELLTDGLRVGEGDTTSGTVFAYQGALNRFYLIGKGKTATYSANGIYFGGDGPFYQLYEEFSPTTTTASEATTDLYQNMWTNGDYYPVKHDCQSVLSLSHYYAMYGKDTTVYKSVSPMVFYIPDLRSIQDDRNYEEYHKPQVGLYRIFLTAETEPSDTYAQDSTYTVTLAWTSTLNDMVNNTVPQTYVIYTVTTDSLGNETYTPLDTIVNPDELTYSYNVKQTMGSQQIKYVVMGFPIYDNSDPTKQVNQYFFTYSNPDDIQIPGLFDFMVLYRERYESDFIINQERNYYRNYLYPTNLAPGTGMTMEQLKKEWPNQTASYTLWRDNTGVAKLEVRGIGNKVYYRIRYYDATQDTTNVNDIAIPNGYQKMPNNN